MNPLARPGPRWFNIPAHRPFVDDLAAGLMEMLAGGGPEALSAATVLLPSRRGARALAEAFVKAAGGQAVLLPQIRALGDLDEGEPPFEPGDLALDLPPAITPWRRRFELAGLVAQHQAALGRSLDATGALELADALGGFFEALQIEEARDLDRIDDLAPEALARHWQISAEFLKIATRAWPQRLAELGLVDVSQRRVALLDRLAQTWTEQPPGEVTIAAGSTGSAPSTARLIAVIAGLPKGLVVLPGLDEGLSDAAWAQVGDQHPQSALRRLLATARIDRSAVLPWRGADSDVRGRWRRRVINEALRPAEATADWRAQIDRLRKEASGAADPIEEGLAGLSVISARSESQAADVIALMLREVLEEPGRTAALVTPDQALARRVSARLARWAVGVDSSAGQPLANAPAAVLANLVARTAPEGCDPVGLLAILKNPLVRLGLGSEEKSHAAAGLERFGLRGVRPSHWEALTTRLETAERLTDALGAIGLAGSLRACLETAAAPFTGGLASPAEAARALVLAMEQLCADAAGDVGPLWAAAAGECLGDLLSGLINESDGLPAVTPAQFAELLEGLIVRETVRTGAGTHARLRILGAIEGRLVRADRLILAGLEEGVWPQPAQVDPFLSRPMRKALGLPPPERRLGLSAHDFAQAACAPEVILVHAERRDEAPAVKSRWLWRLETLAKGAGLKALPTRPEPLRWAQALDAPDGYGPARRPKPTPPFEVRPRILPVTGIEQWMRDPYGAYARRILRLRPLDRPDDILGPRQRGTAVHRAFERFVEHEVLGEDAHEVFQDLLVECLREEGMDEARMARERALAANICRWVVDFERRRRAGARLLVEREGRHSFAVAAGLFTVTAKADRLELRQGRADILDFKTGMPPSEKQVAAGLSPQLTLTGAILAAGGFEEAGRLPPGDLVYVRVSGGRKPGEELVRGRAGESLTLALEALDGLKRRVERFDDPATPYVSWALPQFIGRYGGDYDHLARLWEWHVIGEGEEAAE